MTVRSYPPTAPTKGNNPLDLFTIVWTTGLWLSTVANPTQAEWLQIEPRGMAREGGKGWC
jgi:hypothetical protein